MLVSFKVANVYSFDSMVEFSMVVPRKTSRHKNHVVDLDGMPVLRGAIMYGANAAGKSNFLKALKLLRLMIDVGSCRPALGMQFKRGASVGQDMVFELVYSAPGDSDIFRYRLETNGDSVLHEVLELLSDKRVLFERARLKVDFPGQEDAWYHTAMDRSLRKDGLCISQLEGRGIEDNAQSIAGASVFVKALSGVRAINVIHSNASMTANSFARLFDVQGFRDFLLDLIVAADVGISDVQWLPLSRPQMRMLLDSRVDDGHDVKDGIRFMQRMGSFFAIARKDGDTKAFELRFKHGDVFMSAREESEGTIRLLHMSGFLFGLLTAEETWFVDEIDCHLHPFLAKMLLTRFFGEYNARSQLIVTTHDTNLMASDVWRTDEIWFAEKRGDGSTDLYSMYQFTPRYDKNLAKGYLQGLYGALPFLSRIQPHD